MKFQELKQGSQFQSGTNQSVRENVMSEIIDSNNKYIDLKVRGIELRLKANWSQSGKTVSYNSNLSKDEYTTILGGGFGLKKNIDKYPPYASLTMDGRFSIHGGGNYYVNFMDNSEIEIK